MINPAGLLACCEHGAFKQQEGEKKQERENPLFECTAGSE
jgi:hypothetical protein